MQCLVYKRVTACVSGFVFFDLYTTRVEDHQRRTRSRGWGDERIHNECETMSDLNVSDVLSTGPRTYIVVGPEFVFAHSGTEIMQEERKGRRAEY